METPLLLSTSYIRRLQALRAALERTLRRHELFRPDQAGHLVTPEPESHRPYAPGDDPRYIDWNLYARFDRFYYKTVVTEKEGVLNVLVDASGSMRRPFPEKNRLALEVAGALAYLSLVAGNRVSINCWAERMLATWRFDGGERDARQALAALSGAPEGNLTVLEGTLQELLAGGGNGPSRMVVVGDLIDRSLYQPLLKRIVDTGSPAGVVQVLHPRELEPPLRGHLMMRDPETGAVKRRLMGYRDRRRLRQGIDDFFSRAEVSLAGMGVPVVRCLTTRPFEEAVRLLTGSPAWRRER